MTSQEALIALNMIEGIGPIRVRSLLDRFGSAGAALSATSADLMKVRGIGAETAIAIAAWEERIDLAAELKRIREFDCRVTTLADEEYPSCLREIYDPPVVLYVRGELTSKDAHGIAVVGSRMTTRYGTETARQLASQLAHAGVTVVSGGARGIDTAAHQGALTARGRTIAVLGSGINLATPRENAGLLERIAERGAVVTQFPFNRPPDRQSFPIRNRIVAGLTLGTVVVEANRRSGALITANLAADYGRQVFAVPGRIDSPRSKGCHDLIKKGAKLCESADDVLSEFEYLPQVRNQGASPSGDGIPFPELSTDEREVHAILDEEEWELDAIIQASGKSAASVSVALLGLEMKRLARQLPGKRFVRTRTT